MRTFPKRLMAITCAGAVAALAACAGSMAGGGTPAAPMTTPGAPADTVGLIPPGLGNLRQDDIAIHLTVDGVSVRALPLDDDFIRTLTVDSHRALLAIRDSRRGMVDSIRMRNNRESVDLWYFTFNAIQQGESRFSPRDVRITSLARDYQPLDIIALTPGFSNERLTQRQQASAIYVFDQALDPNQPLTLTVGTQTGGDWRSVLQRVESERARIRSRTGSGRLQENARPW